MSKKRLSESSDRQHKLIIAPDKESRETLLALAEKGQVRIVRELGIIDGFQCEFVTRGEPAAIMEEHPGIGEVHEDITVSLIKPENTFSTRGSRPFSLSPKENWGLKRIRADQVWSITRGKGVKVAFLDTGVNFGHSDLKQALKGGVNILKPNSRPVDDNGHGTNVAGIIGSRSKIAGLSGVAPDAELYAVKAFNSQGEARLSDILDGLEWCVKHDIKLVNLSFGLPTDHKALHLAVKKAAKAGVILVCAAGNEGGVNSVLYPAKYPETVCISASDVEDRLAPFSSTGPEVALIAPGKNIITTDSKGKYSQKSGTSFAAPHVTGVLALLLGFYLSPFAGRDLPAEDLIEILKSSAQPLPSLANTEQGSGLVNALMAVSRLVK